MSKAIRIHAPGGPDALVWEDVSVADPGPGEIRLRQTAIGLNYIDVYHRSGLYPVAALPAVIGLEGAGVVEAVGPGVTSPKVGNRVAYASAPMGAYAEVRVIPADRVVILPDDISDETGAAMMLKGLTVQYLLRRTYRVQPGDPVLIHAAAGGVGLIACQWAKYLGATVIGTVGSDEKAELARAHGCEHPIVYTRENVSERVREVTGGDGAAVSYDSVGKDTFVASLDSLRPLGMMVSFGNSSGPLQPFDPAMLASRGSLFFTRPSLLHYTAKSSDYQAAATELLDVVRSGVVTIEIGQTYPLAEAAAAHTDLEARRTTGSTVMLP